MPKLSDEKIIDLYKGPSFLTVNEIVKASGYFNSKYQIMKILDDARKNGIITPEDDLKNKEAEQREKDEQLKDKERQKTIIRKIVVEKYMSGKTLSEVQTELEEEYDFKCSLRTVSRFLEEAVEQGMITQDEHKKRARMNHAERMKNKRRVYKPKEEGPSL